MYSLPPQLKELEPPQTTVKMAAIGFRWKLGCYFMLCNKRFFITDNIGYLFNV